MCFLQFRVRLCLVKKVAVSFLETILQSAILGFNSFKICAMCSCAPWHIVNFLCDDVILWQWLNF